MSSPRKAKPLAVKRSSTKAPSAKRAAPAGGVVSPPAPNPPKPPSPKVNRTAKPAKGIKGLANRHLGFAPPAARVRPVKASRQIGGAQRLGKALGVAPKTTSGKGFRAGTNDGKGINVPGEKFALTRHLRIGGTTHAIAKAGGQRMKIRIDSGAGNQMVHTRSGAGTISTKTMKAQHAQNAAAQGRSGSYSVGKAVTGRTDAVAGKGPLTMKDLSVSKPLVGMKSAPSRDPRAGKALGK